MVACTHSVGESSAHARVVNIVGAAQACAESTASAEGRHSGVGLDIASRAKWVGLGIGLRISHTGKGTMSCMASHLQVIT